MVRKVLRDCFSLIEALQDFELIEGEISFQSAHRQLFKTYLFSLATALKYPEIS